MKWVQLWLTVGLIAAIGWDSELQKQCHFPLGIRGIAAMVVMGPILLPITLYFPEINCTVKP